MSFHSDAWLSIVFSLVFAGIVFRVRTLLECHWLPLLTAVLVAVPWLQFLAGQITFFGEAWINSLYLLGFVMAHFLGAYWEKIEPSQCLDFLFLGIGVAALASVGIQLHQWLLLDSLEFWINQALGRPYGNIGQPNQMATLLVLALLGAAWGVLRKKLSASAATVFALFILMGVALTQSKTAWINVAIVLSSMFYVGWKKSQKPWMLFSTGFAAFFLACIIGLPRLADLIGVNTSYASDRLVDYARPIVWSLFADAIWQQPFSGYGWGQDISAYLEQVNSNPPLRAIYAHSHNLLLDLVLWNGIPLGGLVVLCICYWFICLVRKTREVRDAIPFFFLVVLCIHAMLELPLHYAYFLLPAGLVAGCLSVRLKLKVAFALPHKVGVALICLVAGMLAITIRDYAHVESSFYDLRFEKARIQLGHVASPPDVWALTQLREMVVIGRVEARENMAEKDIRWMLDVTKLYPSPYNVHKLATALALNHRGAEAQDWLRRLCKAFPEEYCRGTKINWAEAARTSPAMAAVPWPQ